MYVGLDGTEWDFVQRKCLYFCIKKPRHLMRRSRHRSPMPNKFDCDLKIGNLSVWRSVKRLIELMSVDWTDGLDAASTTSIFSSDIGASTLRQLPVWIRHCGSEGG